MDKHRILTTAIGTAVVAAATFGTTVPAMAATSTPAASSSSSNTKSCGVIVTRSITESTDGSFTVNGSAQSGNRIEGRIDGTVVARTVATNGSYTFTVPATHAGANLDTASILGSDSVSTRDELAATSNDSGIVITRSVSENADGSFSVTGSAKAGNRIEGRIDGTVVARTVATNGSYTFTVPATAAGQLLETFSILGSQSVSTSDRLLSQEQNGARVSSIVSLGGDRWRISVVSPGAATVAATPTGDDSIILDEDRKSPIGNPTSEFTLDVTAKAGSSITLWSEVEFEYISTDVVVEAR